MVFSLVGCKERIDGRAQEEPDDFDWKQAVEDAVETKANEKLDGIIPGALISLEQNGNKLDFSLCKVQELLDRDVIISSNLDAELEAGKMSGEIGAQYGKLSFIIKVANLTDMAIGLKDCQVVSCRFENESGELKIADGLVLSAAKREDIHELLGKPYRCTVTNDYYLLPAFDFNGNYYDGYSKYLTLEFKANILIAIEFVIPRVIYHSLEDNVEDSALEIIETMDEKQIETIEQTKKDICDQLKKEFDERGIDCEQDTGSGTILIDSAVVFKSESYAVSEKGKDLLKQICDAYCSVILSDDVKGEISSVSFDGHASPEGTYDYNLDLSEKRAAEVRKIFIENLSGNDAEYFEKITRSEGFSYNYPKYDSNGNVDNAASRRVEIRFILAIE